MCATSESLYSNYCAAIEWFDSNEIVLHFNKLKCIRSYAKLEAQFHALSPQEILQHLYYSVNYYDEILLSENQEDNNLYFLTIANLKYQALNNVARIENMHKQRVNKATKRESHVDSSKKKIEEDTTAVRNMIEGIQVKPKTGGLHHIAGLDNIKNILRTLIISPIKQPQLYENLKPCNCFLLFGPPGTGKTKLVHAMAAEAGVTLLSLTTSSLLSKYVGQSEKMLRFLFQYISNSENRIVLFIDEIDGLCRHRIQDESDHTRRLKTEFMCQLSNFEDCKNSYLICATNCPWELDTAFIRRFQTRLYVPLPDSNGRYNLLKLFTQNTSLQSTIDLCEPVLKSTEGFSGSDIVQLVQHALMIPIMELHQNKVWKFVNNEYYEALSSHDIFDGTYTIHYHDFNDLPPNSVKARKSIVDDLIHALGKVKRTISDNEIKKYECYINCEKL